MTVPLIICTRCHEPASRTSPPCACSRARAQRPGLSRLSRVALAAAALADARGSATVEPCDLARAARITES